jgi:enoyl-[acyl-carrier protein] reductase II
VVEGNVEDGFLMAGQVVGLVREMRTAKEVVEQMVDEAETIIDRLSRYVGS